MTKKKQEKFKLGELVEATFELYKRPKIYLGKNKNSSYQGYGIRGKCITIYDIDTHVYLYFEHESVYEIYLENTSHLQ